jgi:hypothetical protein
MRRDKGLKTSRQNSPSSLDPAWTVKNSLMTCNAWHADLVLMLSLIKALNCAHHALLEVIASEEIEWLLNQGSIRDKFYKLSFCSVQIHKHVLAVI